MSYIGHYEYRFLCLDVAVLSCYVFCYCGVNLHNTGGHLHQRGEAAHGFSETKIPCSQGQNPRPAGCGDNTQGSINRGPAA